MALAGTFAVGLSLPAWTWAQEATPGYRQRLLLENEYVYAVENTYAPGSASPLHSHRFPRLVYVVEGGTLEIVAATGDTSRVELRPGLAVWQPPGTHVVRNVGSSRVRVVEVEVKGADGPGTPRSDTGTNRDRAASVSELGGST